MEYNVKETVYARETIEFVTVAVEYCIFLESFEGLNLQEFTDKLGKLLPLLYLKVQLVPNVEAEDLGDVETVVSQDDYDFIQNKVTAVMGEFNDYLEVFLEDMQYSDAPIVAHVAEDLSDIYQDLRNFVAVYERGIDEHMNDALYICIEHFKLYWGQTLTNVLRALHSVRYPSNNVSNSFLDEDTIEPNFDQQW